MSRSVDSKPRLSRRRRLWFGALTTIIVIATLEIIGFFAWRVQRGEWFGYARAVARMRSVAQRDLAADEEAAGREWPIADNVPRWFMGETVHPYLGYVFDYGSYAGREGAPAAAPIDSSGFETPRPPFRARDPNELVIVITGGSVAYGLAVDHDALVEELAKSPRLAGKKLTIVNATNGGWKQPQQLIAINWLLLLGAPIDLVINLDGFNEVALPPSENLPRHVFPFFPRSWPDLIAGLDVPQTRLATARYLVAIADRREGARWIASSNTIPVQSSSPPKSGEPQWSRIILMARTSRLATQRCAKRAARSSKASSSSI